MDNWFSHFVSKSSALFLVSVLSSLSLYSQDISVDSIIVNDGNTACSYDSSLTEIKVVLTSDGQFDFRGKEFNITVIEPSKTTAKNLTISSTLNSANITNPAGGTVTLSLFTDMNSPLTGPNFTDEGISTINVEFDHDSGSTSNALNNLLSQDFTIINISTPTITSLNTDPSDFTYCSTEDITLRTTDFGGDYKYFWTFSQNPGVTIEGTYQITKNAGELINGERVSLYVTSGNCTSTIVSQTITINEPIANLDLTAAANKTVLCKDETVELTVTGATGGDTIEWIFGSDVYNTNLSTFTVSATAFTSNVTVTVKVTKNGTDCSTEKSIFIQENTLDPGELNAETQVVCSSEIPDTITSVTAASTNTLGTALTYRWERTTNADGDFAVSKSIISNETGENLSFSSPLAQTTYYRRVAIGTLNGVVCEEISNVKKIEVNSVILSDDLTLQAAANKTILCENETVVLNLTGTSDTDVIQWKVGETTFSNYTTSYTLSTADFSSSVTVTVLVTPNGSTCTAEKSIFIEKINFEAGVISSTQTVLCSSQTPSTITSSELASSTTTGTVITYYWESTTEASGNFDTAATVQYLDRNSATFSFSGPLLMTTYFRRVAKATYLGFECLKATDFIKIEVERIDGGTFTTDTQYSCSYENSDLNLVLTDLSDAETLTYQWQKSITDTASSSFVNIQQEGTNSYYEVSLSTTQTTYFRRIVYSGQLSDTTCGVAYSEIFSYIVNEVDPGTLADPSSGFYCYGSLPNLLGVGSAVPGDPQYQWYVNYQAAPSEDSWTAIDGATAQTYQPPPLISPNTNFRRGVILNDGTDSNCETFTEPIQFDVLDFLDYGYIGETDPKGAIYCYGEPHPNLKLLGLTPQLESYINRGGHFQTNSNPKIFWYVSTDNQTWSLITEPYQEGTPTLLNRNNGLLDQLLLTETLYYKAELRYTDQGTTSGWVNDFDQDNQTAVTTQTTTRESIVLFPSDPAATELYAGEIYEVMVGATSVSVTTATNSTTDQVGSALSARLNSLRDINASYYPDQNIIIIENDTSKVLSVLSYEGTAGNTVSLNPYLLSQTNNVQICTTFTSVFTLEVEDLPVLQLGTGVPDGQQICDGNAIDPITIEYFGAVDSFSYSALPAGLVVAGTTSTSITITGTPTTSDEITFNLVSSCYGGDQTLNYFIQVVEDPPEISGIFKDYDDPSYKVFYNGVADTTGYNTSICINTDSAAVNSTNFYACFDESSFTFSKLEWEFIPVASSTHSPVLTSQTLNAVDGVNRVNRIDGKEIGIQVDWNKDFITSDPTTAGKEVNVRVRAISSCNSSNKSDWFEQKVWLINFSDTGTNSQTIPDLPTLTAPEPNITGNCHGLVGYDRIDVPTCELITLYNSNARYTQFYSQASSTPTNDFSSIDWIVESNPVEDYSDKDDVGSIDEIGRLVYNAGFVGSFRVGARPISCSSTVTTQFDSDGYVFGVWYTISQLEKARPTLNVTSGALTCPTPESTTVSTVLSSDIAVNWYVDSIAFINQTKTATLTGENFDNYIGVMGDADNPDKKLTINWKNEIAGEIIRIKAVPKGCAGNSGDRDWVRNFEIYAPQAPRLRIAAENVGSTDIVLCQDETTFTPLLYDMVGKSIIGVEITNVLASGNSSYTSYIETREIEKTQTVTITYKNENSPRNRLFEYILTINNEDFKYTGTIVEESYASIVTKLINEINNTSGGSYVAATTTQPFTFTIKGQPGEFFNVVNNSSIIANPFSSFTSNEVYNQFEISGLNQALPVGQYEFNFSLNVNDGCTDESNVTLQIEVEDNVSISPVSDSSNLTTVCYNENFEDIAFLVTGLDSPNEAFVTGRLPSNVSEDFVNQGSALSSVLTLTSSGITEYWNTRTFNYGIATSGDSCDDESISGYQIIVYPNSFIRPDGHYVGGENKVVNTQQTVCSGSGIATITYEYWGDSNVSVSENLDSANILGLDLTYSDRLQIATIGFDTNNGQTNDNTQTYSVLIDDTEFKVVAPQSATTTSVLIQLQSKIANDSNQVSAQISGSLLYLTGSTSGTTFSVEGTTSDNATFNFGPLMMIQAPKIVTITGTPTIQSIDENFSTATTTKTTYQFNLFASSSNCGNNAQTVTYTLNINPKPRVEKGTPDGFSICDGGNSNQLIIINYKAAESLDISMTPEGGGTTINFSSVDLDVTKTSYPFSITRIASVTETTSYVYTVTATAAFSCTETPTTAVVTGTFDIIPHYLNFVSPSSLMSQTLCVGSQIEPVQFDYSATYSTPNITWGTNGNPGTFTLTTSGTTLTLSGTLDPASTITQTTSYDFVISLEGSDDADSNCFTYEEAGLITVVAAPSLKLETASTTIDQALCLGQSLEKITYTFEGATLDVIDPKWKANGVAVDQPGWVAYDKTVSGEFSFIGLPVEEEVDVITVYEYELVTQNVNVGGFACKQDSKIGYVTLFPDAKLYNDENFTDSTFLNLEVCEGDYLERKIYFQSATSLLISPTISPLGLSYTTSYTVKQSYTLKVSGTAAKDDFATIQIIKNNPLAANLVEEQFRFQASSSDTNSSSIATGLKNKIESITPSQFEVTQTGHLLTLTGASDNKLFGVRFLSSDSVELSVVSATALGGFVSMTGTPTTDLVTETTVYTIEVESVGSSCASASTSFDISLKPFEEIQTTGGSLDQEICYGSAMTPINFSGASKYNIEWSPSIPPLIGISPPSGDLVSPTLQISGTHLNNSASTTSYTYTISLIDDADNCISSETVTGTLTFYPKEVYSISSGSPTQTICAGGQITPIVYDLSGGFNVSSYEVDWDSTQDPAALSFVHSQTAATLTLSGTVPSSVTTTTVYTYTVTLTSEYSCTSTSTTGSITVQPVHSLVLTSDVATSDQTVCEGTAIEKITYNFGNGANDVITTGLPQGLNLQVVGQTLTISGTSTVDVSVPTTYYYTVSTVDALCTPVSKSGYITLLPAPEISFVAAAVPGTDSQEVSICNGSSIEDVSVAFKNTPRVTITNSVMPAGTESLTFTQTITKRQEVEVTITGTSSNVDIYELIVEPVGGQANRFTHTTTETAQTAAEIAQGLVDKIAAKATTVSATLVGSTITIYNTVSSTVFTTKTVVNGEATISVNTTQAVEGLYEITGKVSFTSSVSSFSLDLQTADSSNVSICSSDTLTIKFNLFEAPFISVRDNTTQNNYEVCDGTTVELDFEYGGEQTSISGGDIEWSPENPGFDLLSQVGTNSFTLSGAISKNVTETTTYSYTIKTNGSLCNDITYSGSIDLLPQQSITHFVSDAVEYTGSSAVAEGKESQTICDGNPIIPIVYHLEAGAVSHTLTWITNSPGGISLLKSGLSEGGYSLTLSGTIETNTTTITTYEYTITTNGANCNSNSRVGAITVRPKPLLSLLSSGTNYQVGVDAVCNLNSSAAVVYQYSGSTVSTAISWTGASGAMPGEISTSFDSALNRETYIFNPSTTNSETVIYQYSITSVSQYGCTPQIVLNGAIEVLPSVTILEDYIRANDITHVSCPGGNDGSILIPASPNSEFEKRIYGGQSPIAKVVSVTLSVSNTLIENDKISILIDGITYSAFVPSNTTTPSILRALANEIELGNTKVLTSVNENTLLITASTPGISFTASGLTESTNVTTATTVLSTVTENLALDFDFTWTKNNTVVGNSMSLTNQPAGIYQLSVSINGCATSSATFEIVEPSITYSDVDISCDGQLSIPLSITLTPDQVSGTGNLFSARLYKIVNNVFTAVSSSTDLIEERFSPVSSSSSYVLDFNGYVIEAGDIYRVEVQSESCSELLLEIDVGPITDEILIQEELIRTTDIQCWGENDGTIIVPNNAVIGGSGNYSYVWTSATGLNYYFKDVLNAPPGSYTLTVIDNINDCEKSTTNVFIVNDKDGVTLTDQSSDLINQCIDGTNGFLQLGGAPLGYDIKWEFTPSVTSQTFELTGAASDFQFFAKDQIPNGYSTSGIYTYYIYEGGLGSSCAVDGGTIEIAGPTPVSLSSSLTTTNIICAGEENGTIQFTATGGVAPYFYSINGGNPTNAFSNGNTNYITNLGPGTYDIVIGDSTPADCNPNTYTTQVILTEPEGGPLELSEGEINSIPCQTSGSGSFEVNVTGGSTVKNVSGELKENSIYQVFVTANAGNFKLNTSFDSSEGGIVVENIVTPGDYSVTVTDGSGNCSQEITISVDLEVNENLSAIAQGFNGSDCSANDIDSTGGSIQITQFNKGNGEISGYPIWQRLSTVDMDSFIIALSGSVETFNLDSIGVSIGGTVSQTITASTTESVTIISLADVAAILVDNINSLPNFSATLNGSSITVKSQIIDSVSELTATDSSTSSINLSVSSISKIAESVWIDMQGFAGLEKIENLRAGSYRGVINDTSGCGAGLVQNVAGGNIFRIDDPQTLEIKEVLFEEITCKNPFSRLQFKLSNGSFTIVPDSNIFEINLNSNILKSTLDTGISFSISEATSSTASSSPTTTTSTASSTSTSSSTTSSLALSGNYYTPNLNNNSITIENLISGDYELSVRNTQTNCIVVLNFSLEEPPSMSYTGETEFIIDPCYETYEDPFFDQTLIEGGTPFVNLAGETYYSLAWKFFPIDSNQSVVNINTLSNNINFTPSPGRYELIIRDINGCSIIDDSGEEVPIELLFSKELANFVVNGTGGESGDEFVQPVSCEIDAEDGKINIEVVSADPNNPIISPYTIQWHRQAPTDTAYEQKLLIQGVQAGDSLENYTIRLNDIPITYFTQINNEPKESVVNELTRQIDITSQFEASINPNNSSEIIITTESLALLEMEIISRSTKLNLVKSTSNIATWVPLDGTNDNPNYTGFLDLNDLAEGMYRYTITTSNLTQCENGATPNSIQDVIIVENKNILEIREGPIIDEYLCNGKSGTLFLDVFDGDTGPLSFFYNGTPVSFEQVGTNQYLINIDSPVETAKLEIYNNANCGLSREINIGNGLPLFDFTSVSFEQNQSFLAREDITFTDISENEYDSFEFIFGDGTQTELLERNSPEPITHEYAISGTYYVTLRIYNDLGCVEELTKTIKIGKGYSILVPNVFTPNGDIWNSTFRPIFNGLSEITLRIYDAQGGLLYEEAGSDGADPDIVGLSLRGWEGNTNLPSSPYFIYTITAKTIDDEPVFRDGTFILLQ